MRQKLAGGVEALEGKVQVAYEGTGASLQLAILFALLLRSEFLRPGLLKKLGADLGCPTLVVIVKEFLDFQVEAGVMTLHAYDALKDVVSELGALAQST